MNESRGQLGRRGGTARRLGAGALVVLAVLAGGWAYRHFPASGGPNDSGQPNILWLVSEDTGPQLGAYGDTYASTPNLDRLASRGFRYRVAWANGPVCAAARTALITGVYPESTGGEHMRSLVRLPAFMRLYPTLLREAGYYTANNHKTDYNYAVSGAVWDESSSTADWQHRRRGQPFFAIFNFNHSHESLIRVRPHTWIHDVERAPVPAYMPNVREVREDWAQYYDQVSAMDQIAGRKLAELERAGLTDETIVMYFGDHGAGMPRSKRFAYNSGLQVPLIVYIPPKFRQSGPPEASRPGSESQRLVSFVDLAPTLLSLAGVRPPTWMQGYAFLGRYATAPDDHVFGFRGRIDERYDLVRSVRDARYVYIRNFMPHRPNGQHIDYMFGTPSIRVWRTLFDEGKLVPAAAAFWQSRPMEELYDLEQDPAETHNLAALPDYGAVRDRLRDALYRHARDVRDLGFLPEYELHRNEAEVSPYERGHDPQDYDFDRVFAAATQASDPTVPLATIRLSLADDNPIVRYWGALGAVIRGADAVTALSGELETLLHDAEPGPRIVAAEALGRFGTASARQQSYVQLLRDGDAVTNGEYVALLALYSLNQIPDLPEGVKQAVAGLPNTPPDEGKTLRERGDYLPLLKAAIQSDLR